jgi:hypothetical protein
MHMQDRRLPATPQRSLVWLRATGIASGGLRQLGAVERWQQEIAAGKRSATRVDTLWKAAAWEQSARSAAALGFLASAGHDLQKAALVLLGRDGDRPINSRERSQESPKGCVT